MKTYKFQIELEVEEADENYSCDWMFYALSEQLQDGEKFVYVKWTQIDNYDTDIQNAHPLATPVTSGAGTVAVEGIR